MFEGRASAAAVRWLRMGLRVRSTAAQVINGYAQQDVSRSVCRIHTHTRINSSHAMKDCACGGGGGCLAGWFGENVRLSASFVVRIRTC